MRVDQPSEDRYRLLIFFRFQSFFLDLARYRLLPTSPKLLRNLMVRRLSEIDELFSNSHVVVSFATTEKRFFLLVIKFFKVVIHLLALVPRTPCVHKPQEKPGKNPPVFLVV